MVRMPADNSFFRLPGVGATWWRAQARAGCSKVIPGVGMAAGGGAAYAATFALGKACCWYYGQLAA